MPPLLSVVDVARVVVSADVALVPPPVMGSDGAPLFDREAGDKAAEGNGFGLDAFALARGDAALTDDGRLSEPAKRDAAVANGSWAG